MAPDKDKAEDLVGLEDTRFRGSGRIYRGMPEEAKPPHVQKRNRTAEEAAKELAEQLAAMAPVLDEDVLRQVRDLLVRGLAAAERRKAAAAAKKSTASKGSQSAKQPAKKVAKKAAPSRRRSS